MIFKRAAYNAQNESFASRIVADCGKKRAGKLQFSRLVN